VRHLDTQNEPVIGIGKIPGAMRRGNPEPALGKSDQRLQILRAPEQPIRVPHHDPV
jgi:hypothetical protein